ERGFYSLSRRKRRRSSRRLSLRASRHPALDRLDRGGNDPLSLSRLEIRWHGAMRGTARRGRSVRKKNQDSKLSRKRVFGTHLCVFRGRRAAAGKALSGNGRRRGARGLCSRSLAVQLF